MADETKPLPWDYFLTDYERDLATKPLGHLIGKYPNMSHHQFFDDCIELDHHMGIVRESDRRKMTWRSKAKKITDWFGSILARFPSFRYF